MRVAFLGLCLLFAAAVFRTSVKDRDGFLVVGGMLAIVLGIAVATS